MKKCKKCLLVIVYDWLTTRVSHSDNLKSCCFLSPFPVTCSYLQVCLRSPEHSGAWQHHGSGWASLSDWLLQIPSGGFKALMKRNHGNLLNTDAVSTVCGCLSTTPKTTIMSMERCAHDTCTDLHLFTWDIVEQEPDKNAGSSQRAEMTDRLTSTDIYLYTCCLCWHQPPQSRGGRVCDQS